MLKGLISGGLVGVVVAGASFSVASLMLDPPARDQSANTQAEPSVAVDVTENSPSQADAPEVTSEKPVETVPTEVAPAPETVEPVEIDPARNTEILIDPPAMSAPSVSGSAPAAQSQASALPTTDTESAALPTVTATEGVMSSPTVEGSANVELSIEEPVLPNPAAEAPSTPEGEANLEVQVEPLVIVTEEPVAPVTEEAPPVQDTPVAMDATEGMEAEVEQEIVDLTANVIPEVITTKPPTSLSGTLAGQMPSGAEGVKVNRIAQGESTETAPTTMRALEEFAAEFSNPNDLPLMSIVLIDDGTMVNADAALRGSPFPITVAIDPSLPNAIELMETYRNAGIEVLAVANIAQGATAGDVEMMLEATFNVLPQTIGLIDIGSGDFGSVAATEQGMAVLASAGRGYVTISRGLNASVRAASEAEVPSAVIYRDLDGEDQSAQVIRRFLDQAAFRARQESGVVLLGRVRPDTLSALILWATANRAEQVAQAPVSAVLKAQ